MIRLKSQKYDVLAFRRELVIILDHFFHHNPRLFCRFDRSTTEYILRKSGVDSENIDSIDLKSLIIKVFSSFPYKYEFMGKSGLRYKVHPND